MKTYKTNLLICLVIMSGCIRYPVQETSSHTYYLNPEKDISQIGRVALIDLSNYSAIYQISDNVTESLYQEIQKKQTFGLIRIRQDNPAWRVLQLDPDANYTLEQVNLMRKTLKCDAVMAGTITVYEPYPHMTLGVRLRLVDLSDGQLIWAIEQIWDTTDKNIQNRIQAYYSPQRLIKKDENLKGQLGVVSSLKFFKFVAHEISDILQSNP